MGKEAESMGRKWDEKRGEREEKIPLQREADRTTQGSEHQQQQTYRPPKADREENEERGGKRGNGIREKENRQAWGHTGRETPKELMKMATWDGATVIHKQVVGCGVPGTRRRGETRERDAAISGCWGAHG